MKVLRIIAGLLALTLCAFTAGDAGHGVCSGVGTDSRARLRSGDAVEFARQAENLQPRSDCGLAGGHPALARRSTSSAWATRTRSTIGRN